MAAPRRAGTTSCSLLLVQFEAMKSVKIDQIGGLRRTRFMFEGLGDPKRKSQLTPHIPCIRIDPVRQRAQGRVCGMEEPVPARFRHSCLYRKANKLGGTSGPRHGKALEPAVYRREKRGRCVPGPSTGDFKFLVPGREPAGATIGGVQIWASLEEWPFASDANGSSGVEPQRIGG